ncbi:hypothetical protein CMI45_00155 [Candidatus Pacearchaeota archaeon]|nr:hypothetical protein [Candidatus Pacearchaeota archaeon]|tara:strand:+ start:128 stop:430 length:303 start_codon:yes stop_codon:yes gene_type:complete
MYREDLKLEGIPVLSGNGRYVEAEAERIIKSGFEVPCRIKYKERLKANVDTGERGVKAVAIGPRYMYGLLTEWDVLYFLKGKDDELWAVALSDLIDIKQL